jgi:membrane protein
MWSLLVTAANDWLRDRSARLGAALAHYSVFSLGPLLSPLQRGGLFFGAGAVQASLTAQLRGMLGRTAARPSKLC